MGGLLRVVLKGLGDFIRRRSGSRLNKRYEHVYADEIAKRGTGPVGAGNAASAARAAMSVTNWIHNTSTGVAAIVIFMVAAPFVWLGSVTGVRLLQRGGAYIADTGIETLKRLETWMTVGIVGVLAYTIITRRK